MRRDPGTLHPVGAAVSICLWQREKLGVFREELNDESTDGPEIGIYLGVDNPSASDLPFKVFRWAAL